MKEVKYYTCEICGTMYKDKKECQKCESGHNKPVEIDGATWVSMKNNGSGYPTQVHIKMSNADCSAQINLADSG